MIPAARQEWQPRSRPMPAAAARRRCIVSQSIKPLAEFVGLLISLFAAYWVWQDANRLRANGASLTPAVWTVLVFLLWLVALPVYFLMRRTTWRRHMRPPIQDGSPGSTGRAE